MFSKSPITLGLRRNPSAWHGISSVAFGLWLENARLHPSVLGIHSDELGLAWNLLGFTRLGLEISRLLSAWLKTKLQLSDWLRNQSVALGLSYKSLGHTRLGFYTTRPNHSVSSIRFGVAFTRRNLALNLRPLPKFVKAQLTSANDLQALTTQSSTDEFPSQAASAAE